MDYDKFARELIIQITKNNNFENDTPLDTLKINSIAFIELILSIEKEYGFEFDDEMLILSNLNSVTMISAYIKRKLGIEE